MISTLRIQNFRSYRDESYEFDKGINIIVGPNASGKTNLLEAIQVLASGKSYRAKDEELIRINAPWARVDGYFEHSNRVVKIEPGSNRTKTFQIDDKPYSRLSFEKTIPTVLFEPNHLHIITLGPQQRRDYFDDLLQRSIPGFKTLIASYKRALAQRNALLKHGPSFGAKQLFAWDVRLSELGSKLAEARQNLIDDININLGKTYSQIARRKTNVLLKYESHFLVASYASKMLSKLQATADRDFLIGFTSVGPHREDISFLINNRLINQTASRGETRSILLALKIFELELLEKQRGQKPIFLLDDVFSELDGARRQALVKHLKKHQVIITTTDAEAVVEYFASGAQKLISLAK
jgi:DNA replication and repair protein RecF